MKPVFLAVTIIVTVCSGPARAGGGEGPAKAGHYVREADVKEADVREADVREATDAQSADSRPTFTVGTATAKRGEKAYGVLKVPAGVDSGYDIPVAVIHGARPGPVLAVVAGAHGSEYASIVAVEQLISSTNPADVSGTLILLPIVNVPSFEQITPHVNPTDNKSMNRFYPGNPNGTQTERASAVITKAVVEPCDHLIDLHGGDLDENLRPYSYWTVTGNQKQDDASKAMAMAFGLPYIIVSADRPKDPNASRFLENTATTRGKVSLTAEAGRSGPVDQGEAAMLERGVRNVMAHLKMRTQSASPPPTPIWIDPVITITAEQTGMFHPSVDRAANVTKGAKIGVVTDYLNRPLQEIVSPETGTIMFIRALPSLKKGDTIATVGVIKK